jgi:hypothetical protein
MAGADDEDEKEIACASQVASDTAGDAPGGASRGALAGPGVVSGGALAVPGGAGGKAKGGSGAAPHKKTKEAVLVGSSLSLQLGEAVGRIKGILAEQKLFLLQEVCFGLR